MIIDRKVFAMALNAEDREWVKMVTRETVFAVSKEVLIEHVKSCPHGKAMLMARQTIIGIIIGIGVISGGTFFGLAKLLSGIL